MIINKLSGNNHGKKISENEINNQGEIIQGLIQEGMWPARAVRGAQQVFQFLIK